MTVASIPLPQLELAIQEVCNCLHDGHGCRATWGNMSEEELWRELIACILGSRVRFDVAHSAMERLEKAGLVSRGPHITKYMNYEQDVLCTLSGTGEAQKSLGNEKRYPFSKMRARQIRLAAEALYSNGGSIRRLLKNTRDVRKTRRHLATAVAGLGPKQASLFLRNIGYAAHVAVLDVHVLTYMEWVGLVPLRIRAVRTLRQYETLEDAFIEHSYSSGFPPNLFDLAVWVVVRVVKKEYMQCR